MNNLWLIDWLVSLDVRINPAVQSSPAVVDLGPTERTEGGTGIKREFCVGCSKIKNQFCFFYRCSQHNSQQINYVVPSAVFPAISVSATAVLRSADEID